MMKIALVGCGRHMLHTLIPEIRRLVHPVEVAACIDLDYERAENAAHFFHGANALDSIAHADLPSVDAAILALPPRPSFEVASILLEKGLPLFVEKNPAPTTEAMVNLERLAVRTRQKIQVGFNFRFADAIECLQGSVVEAASPFVLDITFKSRNPSGPEWGIENPVEAWLRHNGIHAVDMARFLAGDILEVLHAIAINGPNSRYTISVALRHQNGSVSILRLGNQTSRFDFRIGLTTAEGSFLSMRDLLEVRLEFDRGHLSERLLFRSRSLDDGRGKAGYGREIHEFVRFVEGKSVRQPPSISDATSASRAVDMILATLR